MTDDDYTPQDNDYIHIKGQKKCACGHPRRVHVRRLIGEPINPKAGGQPRYEHGQCLGVTAAGPMSCECTGYGE